MGMLTLSRTRDKAQQMSILFNPRISSTLGHPKNPNCGYTALTNRQCSVIMLHLAKSSVWGQM